MPGVARPQTEADRVDLAAAVEGARSGDRECWRLIVSSFHEPLVRTAMTWGLDSATASDLVQQTWLAALTHIGALREPAALGGWLRTILRRELIKETTRRRRETPFEDLEAVGRTTVLMHETPLPETVVVRTEERRLLRQAEERLPQRDRDLLSLISESPMPAYTEVSRRLRMPVGSIGPTRGRCFRRLRRELEVLGVSGS